MSSILAQIHASNVLSSLDYVTSALSALDQGDADAARRQLELTLDNPLTQLGAYDVVPHLCNPFDRKGMACALEYYRATRRPGNRMIHTGLQFCEQTQAPWERHWHSL